MTNKNLNFIGILLVIIGIILIIIMPSSIIFNLLVPIGLFLILIGNYNKFSKRHKPKNKFFIINLIFIVLTSGFIMFFLGKIYN
jgi:general stress protein CsbA